MRMYIGMGTIEADRTILMQNRRCQLSFGSNQYPPPLSTRSIVQVDDDPTGTVSADDHAAFTRAHNGDASVDRSNPFEFSSL
jgi:hypothetical protein